jgi:hypothetical protein
LTSVETRRVVVIMALLAVVAMAINSRQAGLRARLGPRAEVVHLDTERLRLLVAQLHAPAHDQFPWASPRLLDAREFVCGWEVYRVSAR